MNSEFTGAARPANFAPPPLYPPVYSGSPADYVVYVTDLQHSYPGKQQSLRNLKLAVGKGRVVGLLGPNGSGKTTLLRILAGADVTYQGDYFLRGQRFENHLKNQVAFLPDESGLDSNLKFPTACAIFADFFADFDQRKATDLANLLQIDPTIRYSNLSKGYRERFQLALTMARRSPLLLLDEPLGGVDPAARKLIMKTMVESLEPETTMLISTHLVHDVEPILDEAVFLDHGLVRCHRNAEELRTEQGRSLNQICQEVYYVC